VITVNAHVTAGPSEASNTAKIRRMPVLVLLRHGESEWNRKNLFVGWVDVDLSPAGEREAHRAGDLLVEHDLLPDVLHTSLLRRAIRTAQISLDVADRHWIPVRRSWRLNERHYGALQGKNRVAVHAKFGDEQFMRWRRSYDTPPPPLPDDEHSAAADPRYADLLETVPRTECLKDGRACSRYGARTIRSSCRPRLKPSSAISPDADIRFVNTGHFALETHVEQIASAISEFLTCAG